MLATTEGDEPAPQGRLQWELGWGEKSTFHRQHQAPQAGTGLGPMEEGGVRKVKWERGQRGCGPNIEISRTTPGNSASILYYTLYILYYTLYYIHVLYYILP